MQNDWYCGIDPGLYGAIAFYNPKLNMLKIYDMPRIKHEDTNVYRPELTTKTELDCQKMYKIMLDHQTLYGDPVLTALETPHSMPHDGHVGAFKFGRVVGMMDGVLGAVGFKIIPLLPAVWKRRMNLSSVKQESIDKALKLFQNIEGASKYFKLKKHDGRAEAAILAWYGYNFFGTKVHQITGGQNG